MGLDHLPHQVGAVLRGGFRWILGVIGPGELSGVPDGDRLARDPGQRGVGVQGRLQGGRGIGRCVGCPVRGDEPGQGCRTGAGEALLVGVGQRGVEGRLPGQQFGQCQEVGPSVMALILRRRGDLRRGL